MGEHGTDARYVDIASWSDAPSRESLDLIAASALDLVGFRVACISIVLDQLLVAVSVAGDDEARDQLLGSAYPVETLRRELESADDWGRFRFLPEERYDHRRTGVMWVPDVAPLPTPDGWRPLDLLAAPLLAPDGSWMGVMSIDVPVSGLRPGPTTRRLLERFAAQAERAVRLALDRAELEEQIRLADTARALVRGASGHRSPRALLREVRTALMEGYRANALWMRADDGTGATVSVRAGDPGPVLDLEHPGMVALDRLARLLWQRQEVAVVGAEATSDSHLEPAEAAAVVSEMTSRGLGTMLVAPLGAGQEAFGMLALTRPPGGRPWSEVERTNALDMGRDLGSAILDARALDRQRQLAEELRQLESYKDRLIATVSHELKTPLTAIVSHLEMLDLVGHDLPAPTRTSLAAMGRGAGRLGRVVDDLLTLARLADPPREPPARVDLAGVVADEVDRSAVEAQTRGVDLLVEAVTGRTDVPGEAHDLGLMVRQLVRNAVRYSHVGGEVAVRVAHDSGQVVLEVVDHGIGIAEQDRSRVFEEFFRSTDPAVRAVPGTGLGLTLVERIVERFGGTVRVGSRAGRGTTVEVRLPAA